jgi:hypothetical protein
LIFTITIALAVLSALISLITFVLYIRARMHEQEKNEQRYRSFHFASLFIFVILGVLILIQLAQRID